MKKVLCWSDSAVAGTGFGVVSKHVLGAIHKTGAFDIHHLAINFQGDFVDRQVVPWQQQPARLLDPKDPHGIKMFLRTLANGNYDIVWICNDLYVTNEVVKGLQQVKQKLMSEGKQWPIFIYYYPVDCHVPPDHSAFIKEVDVVVCYTDHGREETLKTFPNLGPKLHQIPHGVDTKVFQPLSEARILDIKRRFLGVGPDTTVVLNVNRNSTRKQIPYSFLAFKEFRKKVPNSIMYCHAAVMDQGGNLAKAIVDAGMSFKHDIIFPAKYSPSNPISEETLNQIYNAADIFLTTHLGEGWGLTITESLAAGTPVVSPNNTCMPQQLGEHSERGYMYKCKDMTWVDNSGYRPKGLLPDIVDQMMHAYNDGPKWKNPKCHAAREWALTHDWDRVTEAWVHLFNKAAAAKRETTADVASKVLAETL